MCVTHFCSEHLKVGDGQDGLPYTRRVLLEISSVITATTQISKPFLHGRGLNTVYHLAHPPPVYFTLSSMDSKSVFRKFSEGYLDFRESSLRKMNFMDCLSIFQNYTPLACAYGI